MSLVVWIVLGVLLWTVLGAGVAVLVGRTVRQRDRQVPEPGVGLVPAPRDGHQADGVPARRPVGGVSGHRPPV